MARRGHELGDSRRRFDVPFLGECFAQGRECGIRVASPALLGKNWLRKKDEDCRKAAGADEKRASGHGSLALKDRARQNATKCGRLI